MGSRWESGWLGRRRLLSMANPTVCKVSFCYDHAMVEGLSLINLVTGFPDSGRDQDQDKKRLTGPMMVACQWNYSTHLVSM
jgi:hypothetical protein